MNYHVVTTTNAEGWEQTGRRMAESFLDRWKTGTLTVYAEDFDPDVPVEVRQLPEWQADFKAKYGTTAAYVGQYRGRYDFRFDMVRFSHKVAAMTDFGVGVTDGVMVWLDADTFTHADVTEEWLESLFPERAYLAWLERRGSSPETGFVMFRASHPYHVPFMEAFRRLYTSGRVTDYREFHDAFVLWQLTQIKVSLRKIPPPHNLSGDARNWHHPFCSSELGSRMDHMKGPRKEDGKSNIRHRDLMRPRSEVYWNT